MFCGKCGSNIPEGASGCPNCGEYSEVRNEIPTMDVASSRRNKTIGIVAVAAVVVIVAVVLIIVLTGGGNSKKKDKNDSQSTARSALELLLDFQLNAKGSSSSYVSVIFPDEILEAYCEYYDTTNEELISDLNEDKEDEKERLKDNGITYKFEFLNETNMDDDDLDDCNEVLEDYGLKATAGKTYKVEVIKCEGSDTDTYDTDYYTMIKIGGSWYCWSIMEPYAELF